MAPLTGGDNGHLDRHSIQRPFVYAAAGPAAAVGAFRHMSTDNGRLARTSLGDNGGVIKTRCFGAFWLRDFWF